MSYPIRINPSALKIPTTTYVTQALYVEDKKSASGYKIHTQEGKTFHSFAFFVGEYRHLLKSDFNLTGKWGDVEIYLLGKWTRGDCAEKTADGLIVADKAIVCEAAFQKYLEDERDAEEEFIRKKELSAMGI